MLAVLAPAARAQLISEGDPVPGVGAITAFHPPFAGVTDTASWMLVMDTDHADITQDTVLLRDFVVAAREGMLLALPVGSRLGSFLSVDLADDGDLGMVLATRNPTNAAGNLYWNLTQVANLTDAIASPELGANTKWLKFDVAKLNTANQLFALGEVDNTAVAFTREDALIRYDLDALGNVVTTDVLVTRGQFNAALATTVVGLSSLTEHVLAVNEHGDYITFIAGDGVEAVMINAETIVAQEGALSSVGVPWRILDLTKVGINDFGDHVVSGLLEGAGADTYLLEKNGQRFARSGDVLPALSSSPLAPGRANPVDIANDGHVFWQAWTQTDEAAYMRDHEPIIKTGSTLLGPHLVVALPFNEHSFAVSPDGRFFLCRIADLQGVGESSLLVDFGLIVPVPGCAGNSGSLAYVSGDARVGETFRLALDAGQEPGVLPAVTLSGRARIPGSDCGTATVAGELLISPQHRIATLFLPPWDGANPVAFDVTVPNDPALVDLELHAQGIFQDVTGPVIQAPRLTNALRIQIGAP